MAIKPSKSSSRADLFPRLLRGDWSIFRKSSVGAGDGDELDLTSISEALLSRRGEASGTMLAQRVLAQLGCGSSDSRLESFAQLGADFGGDSEHWNEAIQGYQQAPDNAALHRVHKAAEPRRQELIRRLNYSVGGTHRLIKMRERLLGFIKEHPELKVVDSDFLHLFTTWFNPGFLEMRPMDWGSPANILERLIKYEAVHAIHDWNDLRSRLDPTDRRWFAFFHPPLSGEPLSFVEVALSKDIPGSIQQLLDVDRTVIPAELAKTAVFYSISNTQKGLSGVPFGSFLLKQVIEYLKQELPNLSNFVTLSPVPRFARWLAQERAADTPEYLSAEVLEALEVLDSPAWHQDEEKAAAVQKAFMESARTYFLQARNARGTPVDPVARFHLRNGAELHRLNFLGDISDNGLTQAHGLMVNYLYRLDEIEQNHEAFVERREVKASKAVTSRR